MSDSISNGNIPIKQQLEQQNEEQSAPFRSIPSNAPLARAMIPLPSLAGGLATLTPGKRSLASLKPVTTASSSINALEWKVDPVRIPAIPDYPLERTHLKTPLSLEEVTIRISSVLKALSLNFAVPPPDEDTDEVILDGRIDCIKEDDVETLKMVVQLYRAPFSADNKNEWVVELQRRNGSAIAFASVRKAVFQMIRTGNFTCIKPSFARPSMAGFVPKKKFRIMPASRSA